MGDERLEDFVIPDTPYYIAFPFGWDFLGLLKASLRAWPLAFVDGSSFEPYWLLWRILITRADAAFFDNILPLNHNTSLYFNNCFIH